MLRLVCVFALLGCASPVPVPAENLTPPPTPQAIVTSTAAESTPTPVALASVAASPTEATASLPSASAAQSDAQTLTIVADERLREPLDQLGQALPKLIEGAKVELVFAKADKIGTRISEARPDIVIADERSVAGAIGAGLVDPTAAQELARNADTRYLIAPLRDSPRQELIGEFRALAFSGAGTATFAAYDFIPATSNVFGGADEPQRPTVTGPSSLSIVGAVAQPLDISADTLRARLQTQIAASDKRGDTRTFQGVPLRGLLEEAGVAPEAQSLLLLASDDYLQQVPLAFVRECADCVIVVRDDNTLQAILPGYDQAAWVRQLVQIDVR